MWNYFDKADLFLITTNSFIANNGELVMGTGIAKQAKEKYPSLPLAAGKVILESCGHLGLYGCYISKKWPKGKIGLFQTKKHWQEKSTVDIIKRSLFDLDFWLIGRHDKVVCLNFPGIGYGGLERSEVLPLLEFLPANVWIYQQ